MFYPSNHAVNFHMMRLANHIAPGGADLTQMVEFVQRVPVPDPVPWYQAWHQIAAAEQRQGEAALAADHRHTAREYFLRACNYHREAGFYLDYERPEKAQAYKDSRQAFHQALPLLMPPLQHVAIPWRGRALPGYLGLPPGPGPHPGIVFIGGADATKEELYFTAGKRLLDRGFAVLTVDGPGQGESRIMNGLYTTPEWESLGQPAFAALAGAPGVDPDRIGLLGISMGGYYAPKMAVSGAPYRCLVVWGGCFDVVADLYTFCPHLRPQLRAISNTADDAAALAHFAPYRLHDVAPHIRCPVLITHGGEDRIVSPEAATKFAAALKVEKDIHIFAHAIHCMYDIAVTALPLMFDWLEDHLTGAKS